VSARPEEMMDLSPENERLRGDGDHLVTLLRRHTDDCARDGACTGTGPSQYPTIEFGVEVLENRIVAW